MKSKEFASKLKGGPMVVVTQNTKQNNHVSDKGGFGLLQNESRGRAAGLRTRVGGSSKQANFFEASTMGVIQAPPL